MNAAPDQAPAAAAKKQERDRIANERQVLRHIASIIAYHEAGHAVFARLLGVDVHCVKDKEVSIDPPWRSVGRMDSAALIDAFHKDILLTLAGPLADEHLHDLLGIEPTVTIRFLFDTFDPFDDDDDASRIRASISSIVHLRGGGDSYLISPDAKGSAYRPTIMPVSEATMSAEFDRYEAEATRMVKQHWHAIERVAKAIERCDLDQDELDRLLNH